MRLQSVKSRNIGSVKAVLCPETIKLYNQYMNGIDHTDQLRSMYDTARKALKWRKYLFFFLFDVAMVNVYLLMRVSAQHVLKKPQKLQEPDSSNGVQNTVSTSTAREIYWKEEATDRRPGTSRTIPGSLANSDAHKQDMQTVCNQKKKSGLTKKFRTDPTYGCERCNVNWCAKYFKPYHFAKFPELR